VQPLGGVAACLRIADEIGLPVVVSSALETSVGIAAGVALAAALPELPYACGLATLQLLDGDVTSAPFRVVEGALPVVRPEPDLGGTVAAGPAATARWLDRMKAVEALAAAPATPPPPR
jgi:O-succinylbenzoate synthase